MFENFYIWFFKIKVIINKEELLNWKVELKIDKCVFGVVIKKKEIVWILRVRVKVCVNNWWIFFYFCCIFNFWCVDDV